MELRYIIGTPFSCCCCCPCRLAYDLTLPEGAEGVKEFLGGALGMEIARRSVGGLADDVAGSVSASQLNLARNTRSRRRTSSITFQGRTSAALFTSNRNPRRTKVVCRRLNSKRPCLFSQCFRLYFVAANVHHDECVNDEDNHNPAHNIACMIIFHHREKSNALPERITLWSWRNPGCTKRGGFHCCWFSRRC